MPAEAVLNSPRYCGQIEGFSSELGRYQRVLSDSNRPGGASSFAEVARKHSASSATATGTKQVSRNSPNDVFSDQRFVLIIVAPDAFGQGGNLAGTPL